MSMAEVMESITDPRRMNFTFLLHLGVKRLQKLQITQMNNGLYGVI